MKTPAGANSSSPNDTLIDQSKENRSYRHSLKPRQAVGADFNYGEAKSDNTHARRAPENSELFRPILNANKSRFSFLEVTFFV